MVGLRIGVCSRVVINELGDLALLGEGFVGGLFGGDDFAELGHGDLGQVAAGDLPFVPR